MDITRYFISFGGNPSREGKRNHTSYGERERVGEERQNRETKLKARIMKDHQEEELN